MWASSIIFWVRAGDAKIGEIVEQRIRLGNDPVGSVCGLELKKRISLGRRPGVSRASTLRTPPAQQRYEQGSLIFTTNKKYNQWAEIFNADAGITSAILDRVLHNAETVTIEGEIYRMKDQGESAA
jgi:hypothetical protein